MIAILFQPVDIEQGLWPHGVSIPTRDYQRASIPFDFGDDDVNFGIRGSVVDALDMVEIWGACDDGLYIPAQG